MPFIGFTPDKAETPADLTALVAQKPIARRLAVVHVRAGGVEQNLSQVNSLCTFFQNRAESAPLCARDCGTVTPPAALTTAAGQPYRCHAGLHIVRVAPRLEEVFIGGRALVTQRAYQTLTERFRRGDLRNEFTPAVFSNLIWASLAELSALEALLSEESGTSRRPLAALETMPPEANGATVEALSAMDWPRHNPAENQFTGNAWQVAARRETLTESYQAAEDCPAETFLVNGFTAACAAALRILAGACGLSPASLWWRHDGEFVKACGLGAWTADGDLLHCAVSETQLLAAAESHSSLPAERDGDTWQIGAVSGQTTEAEFFPFLAGTEIKAAFLLPRTAPDDPARRAIARYGRELALPLEVLRLQQEMARRTQQSEQTVQFVEALQAAGAADGYSALLRQTAELLHSQRASLMVYEETEGRLEIKAGLGLPGGVEQEARLRPGEGVAGRVWHTGRPWLAGAETRNNETPPVEAERAYRTPSFLSYPINVGGQRIGVLNVTDRADGSPFDESDVRLLDTIAPHLGLALDRAEWREKAILFQRMSITDPLTGLANRRYLMARLAEEVSRAERHQTPVCFIMLDLDNFKAYNDNNGHQAGDEALILLAQCLRSTLRAVDIAARYGGEEFSILLPQTTLREGSVIAERIRRLIAAAPFPHGAQQPGGKVSVSLGVADYAPGRNTSAAIIKAADEALYQAKNAGRDQVQVFGL